MATNTPPSSTTVAVGAGNAWLATALTLLGRRRGVIGLGAIAATALSVGYASLQTQQRRWIFQATPTPAPLREDASDGSSHDGRMANVWIDHVSAFSGRPIRLHALWAPNADAQAPILLYLHGARRDVAGSAFRIEQLRGFGFSVLAIDYRGFGYSTDELPSEAGVLEDAVAAWRWLGQHHADRPRYLYGHSLGGAIGVQLAARLAEGPARDAPSGVILENTFTSIGELFSTFKWGWLPISMVLTQRFDSLSTVPRLKAPLLIVHGSADGLVPYRFGQALYEKATVAKRFLLVEGGNHSNTTWRGREQVRAALREFFGVGATATPTA
ncbi:MAG TPA: alpha/beta fold hydrolase [Caldimonas sp.]|nr:alpha/beta fold hydrolase [Caldimonas sp.]